MKSMVQKIQKAPNLNVEGLYRDLGKVLIVAPHPDDESLACGGLISYLKEQDAEVHILFMTNGEASHPNSKQFPANKLGELRKSEAISACSELGVPVTDIIFLNAGDGKLASLTEEESFVKKKLHELFEQGQYDTVFIPWRRDHHIDHISTNNIINKVTEGLEILTVEYPVWLWKKGRTEDWPTRDEILPFKLKIQEVKEKKLKAINSHKSQVTSLIKDDPEGFVFTEELLEPFLQDHEFYFFPKTEKPPVKKTYFDHLFSESNDPWNFETSSYEKKKYQKTLEAISGRNFMHALEIGCANGVFTNMLASKCEQVLALEQNQDAINAARKRTEHYTNCKFLKWDVKKGLPEGNFDLVVFSEVGYYFSENQLKAIYKNIDNVLRPEGVLIMVHWTSFVREYPLTGLQVHEIFKDSCAGKFKEIESQREELYDLVVWEKDEK